MDAIQWTAVAAFVTVCVAVGTVLVRLIDRINTVEKSAAGAERDAKTATARVIEAEKDLVEHRIAVAREYASNSTIAALESRILQEIGRLGERLDKFFHPSH